MKPLVRDLAVIVNEMNYSLDRVTRAAGIVETIQALHALSEEVRHWKADLLQLAALENTPYDAKDQSTEGHS